MRHIPSNVPTGRTVRPILGVAVALLVVTAVFLVVTGGSSSPEDVRVTASANESLVPAAEVDAVETYGLESAISEAVIAAHRDNESATVEATTEDLGDIHWGSNTDEMTVWIEYDDVQYRVAIVESGVDGGS